MKDFSKTQRWDIYAVGDYSNTEYEEYSEGDWVRYEDHKGLFEVYELQVIENLAPKTLLDRAHERLDELKQPTYTGTGSDYLDCVLGVGGFESFGPINGDGK